MCSVCVGTECFNILCTDIFKHVSSLTSTYIFFLICSMSCSKSLIFTMQCHSLLLKVGVSSRSSTLPASRNAPPWTVPSSMYSGALVLDLSWAVGGEKGEERAHNESGTLLMCAISLPKVTLLSPPGSDICHSISDWF